VITELDVGGAERSLVSLASRLDRTRWSPQVVGLGPEGPLVEDLQRANVPCRCLGVNRNRPLQAVARLAAALRYHRPELVQSFLFHANVATRLAAPLAGAPWVVGGLRVAERQQRWHLWLDRITARLAAGSVCVSAGVSRFAQEAGGLSADRLTVIPNGIDVARIDDAPPLPRTALGLSQSAHVALFVGRLTEQKGLPELLTAASVVMARQDDWYLVVVGEGSARELLRQWRDEHPALSHRLIELGQRRDVPSLLKTADLLVLSSRWEGMPNVVLEAMAAGRPVVATAAEGTEDLVVPGETGWLTPPGDSQTLAIALLEAAEQSPEERQRFGEAGRRRVKTLFSLDHVVESYEQLWAGLLSYALPHRMQES
jgi:starch synthase (maltosyl-transferring)